MSEDNEILDSDSPKKNYKPVIRKVIFGVIIFLIVTGMLFRVVHWPFGPLISMIGGGMLLGFLLKRFFYEKGSRKTHKTHYLIIAALFTIYFIQLYNYMPWNLVYFYFGPALILFLLYPA